MAMDLEMWLRLAKLGPIVTVGRTLAAYRDSPGNKTNTRRVDMLWEAFRAVRKHVDLAPRKQRSAVRTELRRRIAGHLLTIVEEDRPANSRRLMLRALALWPPLIASQRVRRALLAR